LINRTLRSVRHANICAIAVRGESYIKGVRHFFRGGAMIACLSTSFAQPPQPALSREAATVRSYDGRSMPAERVRITVPERRAHPGRTITVAALRIPTVAEHPGHPVVFLMGGPGIPGTVMAPIPPYFSLFQRLREFADVLIVDQRGLGDSQPELDCAVDEKLPADFFAARDRMAATIRRRVASCAEYWRAKGRPHRVQHHRECRRYRRSPKSSGCGAI
jgi:hypothetical protein